MSRADPPSPPGPVGPGAGTAAPRRKLARRGPRPMALEQRYMFDGAAVVAALPDLGAMPRPDNEPADPGALPPHAAAVGTAGRPSGGPLDSRDLPALALDTASLVTEILFVDTAVPGLDSLRTQLRAGVELVVLDAASEPWAQMTQTLARHQDLQAVHLLTHGAPGRLLLSGDAGLQDALASAAAAEALERWAAHLSAQADILVYGCASGAGDSGRLLLERMARLTQADVAASTDASGSATAGGNWVLEAGTGRVEATLPFAADWLAGTPALLAAPTVSTTATALEVVEPSTLNQPGASTATLAGWTLSGDGLGAPQLTVDVTLADTALGALEDPGGGQGGLVSALPDGLRFVGPQADAQAWLNQLRFTAADVELGTTAASTLLTVRVSDGGNPALATATTLPVTVTPSNDPTTVADGRLPVVEGAASTRVDAAVLAALDPEVAAGSQSPDQIVYTLVAAPAHGRLLLRGAALGPGSSFTHADVIDPDGPLVYEHTAGGTAAQNTGDRFELSINDGATGDAQSDTAVVTVPITPVNQAPVVASGGSGPGGAFVVFEGQPFDARSGGIEQSRVGLAVVADGGGDPGDAALDLAITRLPSFGELRFTGTARVDGTALAFDRTLTAADLGGSGFVIAYADRGALHYQHDGSDVAGTPADDTFDVTVTDGGGGTATRLSASATILIDLRPVNDEPVLDPASSLRASVTINGPNGVLDRGGDDYRVGLGTTMLRATDADSPNTSISFVLARLPQDGELLLDDAALQSGASFTMADLAAGRVQYVQRAANVGGANAVDDFAFQVRDGTVTLRWDGTGEDFLRAGGIYDGAEATSPLRTFTFTLTLADTPTGSGGSGSTEATPVPVSTLATQHVGLPPTGSAVGSLAEGGSVTLSGAMLSYAAGSVPAGQIVYTIAAFEGTAGAWNGSLQKNGTVLGVFDSFTQGDVDAGRLRFVHAGGEDFESAVRFYVTAPGAASAAEGLLTFHATPVNDAPTATGAVGVTLAEGGSVTVNAARLALADPDDATSESYAENDPAVVDNLRETFALDHGAHGGEPLRWRVAVLPAAGRLQVDLAGNGSWTDITAPDVSGQTMYAASLVGSGRLRYVHDGLEVRSDSFQVVARDRWGAESTAATVTLAITNINDAPEIAATPLHGDPATLGRPPSSAGGAAANEPLTVIEEGSYTRITSAMLQAYDPDSTSQQVQYRITTAPATGRLAFSANGSTFTTIGVGSSFSQRQVQDGQIYFIHAGGEPASSGYPGAPDDRFFFTLSDGNREQAGNEFWIYVQPTNDPPSVTAPAGPVDIDSLLPERNAVAGFSVTDPDLANGLQAGERDFVQVTVRLQSAGGAAPGSYATGFGGGAVRLGHATPADAGGGWAVTRSGVNDILQFQGSRSQVNAALAGLSVTFERDLDASWTLQVIADDRLRDAGGALSAAGNDANGGELNQPTSETGAPTAVPATVIDWAGGATVPAGHPNIAAASVVLRASSVNDEAALGGPASTTVQEDVRSRVAGSFVVADAESAAFDLPVTATLAVTAGTLDLGAAGAQASLTPAGGRAVAISGDGTALLGLNGRAADIQALLNGRNAAGNADDPGGGLYYTSAPNRNDDQNAAEAGDVTLTLTLDDAGSRIGGDTGAGSTAATPAAARLALEITAVNDAPVLSGTVVSPTASENGETGATVSVPGARLLSGALVADPDLGTTTGLAAAVFGAGTVTVALLDGIAGDRLQVSAALPAGVTVAGGSGNVPLVLALDDDTTLTELSALLNAIEYTHTGDDPTVRGSDMQRQYRVTVDDGNNAQASSTAGGPAGLSSAALQGTVTLVAANDAPTLDLDLSSPGTGRAMDWVEAANAPHLPRVLFPQADLSDPDNAMHSALDVSVSGVVDGNSEVLLLGSEAFALATDRAAVEIGSFRVAYRAADAKLSVVPGSGATASAADFTALLRDLRYVHQGDRPTAGARTLTVTLGDAGLGDSAPLEGVAVATATATVTVVPANDQPELTLASARTLAENTLNAQGVVLDNALAVIDADSDDLGGGSLRISGLVAGQDWIGLPTTAASDDGTVRMQDGTVQIRDAEVWKAVGTVTGGDGTDLRIDFGAGVLREEVQQVLRQVQFGNRSDDPVATRTLVWTLDDGDGGTALGASLQVTITPENDAPTFSAGTGDRDALALAETDAGLTGSGTLTLVDPDRADTVTTSVAGVTVEGSTGATLPTTAQALAMLSLDGSVANAADPGSGGNLTWRFDSAGQPFDRLAEGDSLVLRYTLRAQDSGSPQATAARTVTVTIAGRNDAPVLSALDVGGTLTEDATSGSPARLREDGAVAWTDADAGDLARATVTHLAATGAGGAVVDAALAQGLAAALSLTGAGVDAPASAGTVSWSFALDNALVQGLGAGESVSARYRIDITDDSGAANALAGQEVVLQIQGANDRPVITAMDVAGAVTEDATASDDVLQLVDQGSLGFSDADLDDRALASVTLLGVSRSGGGTIGAALQAGLSTAISLSGAGVGTAARAGTIDWRFVLDNALVQDLATGETLTAIWRVTVTDDSGTANAGATQDLTVTVSGLNDGPTLATVGPSVFVEQADASAQALARSGTIEVRDTDSTDSLALSAEYNEDLAWSGGAVDGPLVAGLTAGTFSLGGATLAPPGLALWRYQATDVDLDFLGAGESLSFSFAVAATDRAGAAGASIVSFVIDGRNDAPVVTASELTGEVTEGQATDSAGTLRDSGSLSFDDPDANDRVRATVTWLGVSAEGQARMSPALSSALAGALSLSGAGLNEPARSGTLDWAFTLDDALVRHLGPGQALTASWRIELTDDSGATDARTTRDVVVTVRGANTVPTLTLQGDPPTDMVEALDASAQVLAQSGTLGLDDADDGSLLGLGVAYNNDIVWSGGTLDPALAQALTGATLTLSADETRVPGTVRWDYLAPALDLDFLGAGQTIQFSYTISASDADGATATTTVPLRIVGTDERPTPALVDLSGSVVEDRTTGAPARLRDTGAIGFADLSTTGVVATRMTFAGTTASTQSPVDPALIAALADALQTGTAVVDPDTAYGLIPWAFTLDNALAQGLAAGDSVLARWQVALADDPSIAQEVTVTLHGANDAPSVLPGVVSATVAEEQTSGAPARLRATGSAAFSDLDRGDLVRVQAILQGATAAGGAGIDPALAQALAGALSVGGDGVVTAAASGTVTWAFDLDNARVQFLGAGESVTATWRLEFADDSGHTTAVTAQDLVVTIVGANDAPVLNPIDVSASLGEDDADGLPARLREAGTVAFADLDASDRISVSVALLGVERAGGVPAHPALDAALAQALSLSGPGVGQPAGTGAVAWAFELDPLLVQSLGPGQSVTATWRLSFNDDSGALDAGRTQDVSVTITGANDAPTVTAGRTSGSVTEDLTEGTPLRLRDSGTLSFDDVDAGQLVRAEALWLGSSTGGGATASVALAQALAGALSLSGAGMAAGSLGWAFELDNALVQYLGTGESVTGTWRIRLDDGSGAANAATTRDLSITVRGANDAPLVTSAELAATVTEDVVAGNPPLLRASGTLSFADADATDLVRVGVGAPTLAGSAGVDLGGTAGQTLATALGQALTLSGPGLEAAIASGSVAWVFALDNASTQFLGADESVTATWRLGFTDDSGSDTALSSRELVITVRGANDAPQARDDPFDVALGGVVKGALIAGSDSDDDGETLSIVRVGDNAFADLAPSTDAGHPATAGWRELRMPHGTLYLREDGSSAYAHAGRTFLVEPLGAAGVLEQRLADGRWQVLDGAAVFTLQALQSGALRYTPGPGEVGAPDVTPARLTELDWRTDRVSYTVSDGRAESTAWLGVTVGSGADAYGAGIRPGADADVDGIPSEVEAALASRITGEAQGLRAQAYVLGPAHLEAADPDEPMLLTLKAAQQGDLGGDGTADALQNAVATFAWIDHVQFALGNSAPGDLASDQPIVTLVAQSALTGSGLANAAVQLGGVQVQALSAEQAAAFEARFGFSSRWSPLAFTAAPLAGTAGAGTIDLDPAREGAQWRFTIDLSRSGEALSGYLGFVKWIDPATIERYRDAGLQLLDLDGQAITAPGWVDFSRRAPGGDGALLASDGSGRLWLDIVITDNRFGDADTAAGRIADPGLPVFVNERDDRRPLTLSQPVVNEGSPWAHFQVQGAARQLVTLRLEALTATGGGIDFGSGDTRNLMVSRDGGASWTAYTGGEIRLSDAGGLLVRTPITNDAVHEGSETFRLVARTTGGLETTGLATLRDDGGGAVFRDDGTIETTSRRDDDRPVHAPPPAPAGPTAAATSDTAATAFAAATAPESPSSPAPFTSALALGGHTALTLPDRPALGDVLTSPSGFRVVVIESGRPGLSLYRPVADQFFPSNRTVSFTIPSDTFAHTKADAVLRLQARLADGRELPGWVRFDPRTGTFVVTPPAGLVGDLEVRVIARDQDGREASTLFKIKVTSGVMVNPGRPGLSEQLGAAGESQRPPAPPARPAGEAASERPQAGKTRPEPGKRAIAGPTRVADRPGPAERGEVAGKKRPAR